VLCPDSGDSAPRFTAIAQDIVTDEINAR